MNTYWYTFPVVRGWETVAEIFDILARRGFIGGSFAAFMAAPVDKPIAPNDVDIFATSASNAEAIASALEARFICARGSNPLTITLRPMIDLGMPIQIVKPNPEWKTFPDDILSSFDFDICRAVLLNSEEVLADTNVGQLKGKILRLNNPLRSLKRVIKYTARGVEFPDWELLKLFQGWEAMPRERKDGWVDEAAEALTAARNAAAAALMGEAAYADDDDEGYDWLDDDDYFDGE
jgi:hypothetical protein